MATSNLNALGRFLDRLLRHSTLSNEEKQAILGVSSEAVQVAAHRDIVSPGVPVDRACLVVKGLAGRYDQMRDGRRQVTTFHIPGDMCDLHSVAVPKPSWSVTAFTTTTILKVPHSDLRTITERFPNVAMAFWRDTVIDAAILAKWVGNLGRKSAEARLAHILCEMGVRMDQANLGQRTSYEFGVTQEQLADAAGMTSVHLNRTLQALRAAGAIVFHARQVQILDWKMLVETAEFDPDYLFANGNGPAAGAAAPLTDGACRALNL